MPFNTQLLVNYKNILDNLPKQLEENQEYMIIVKVSNDDKKTVEEIEIKRVNWLTRRITKIAKRLTPGKIYHFENDAFRDLTDMIDSATKSFSEWTQKQDQDLKDKNIKQLLENEEETYHAIHEPLIKLKRLFNYKIAQNFHSHLAHFENMHHAAVTHLKAYEILREMKALMLQGKIAKGNEEDYFNCAKTLFELKESLLREKLICKVEDNRSGKIDQEYLTFLETQIASIDQEKEDVVRNMKSILLEEETWHKKIREFEEFPDVHQQLKNAEITRPLVKSLQAFKAAKNNLLNTDGIEHQVSFIEKGLQVLASYRETSKEALEDSDQIKQEFDALRYIENLNKIFNLWENKVRGENRLADNDFIENLDNFVAFIQIVKEKGKMTDPNEEELQQALNQKVQELEKEVKERAGALLKARRNEADNLKQAVKNLEETKKMHAEREQEYAKWRQQQHNFFNGSDNLHNALTIDDEIFTQDDKKLIDSLQQEVSEIENEETFTSFLSSYNHALTQFHKRNKEQIDKLRERYEHLNGMEFITSDQQAEEMDNALMTAEVIKKELGGISTIRTIRMQDLNDLLKSVKKKPIDILSAITKKVPSMKKVFIKIAENTRSNNELEHLLLFIQDLRYKAQQLPWDRYGYYRMPDKDLYELLFSTLKELGYSEPQTIGLDKLAQAFENREAVVRTAVKAINPRATDEDIQEIQNENSLGPKIEKIQAMLHILNKRRILEREQQENKNALKKFHERFKRLNDFTNAVSSLIQASENLSKGNDLLKEKEYLEREITRQEYEDPLTNLNKVKRELFRIEESLSILNS